MLKQTEILIPNQLSLFIDKKTGVKTAAFPFTFADGNNGILSITKLVKMGWIPPKEIEKIIIQYKYED